MRSRVSVRRWPRPWLPVSLIRKHSGQDATSQPGLVWYRSSIPAEAKKSSAVSASKVIAICAALFTAGALAVIRYAKIYGTKHRPWLAALLARRPTKRAAIALANKLARMVWAMMTRGERYKEPVALAARTRLRRLRPDATVGKGKQHVMQTQSIQRSGQPTRARASIECELLTGT